jgi:hypothetical protein
MASPPLRFMPVLLLFLVSIVPVLPSGAAEEPGYFVPESERYDPSRPPPVAWPGPLEPPASMPVPCERLKGDAWKSRFEACRASLPDPAQADDSRPLSGLRILAVAPDTQAKDAGLEAGNYILAIDGQRVFNFNAFTSLRLDRLQQLLILSSSKGMRAVKVQGGRIGLTTGHAWEPGLAYLRSKSRNGAWEPFMRVACASWDKDEVLAETALFHAVQAGYREWLVPVLMACMTSRCARYAEAFAWLPFAQKAVPDDQRQALHDAFCRAALLGGRPELAVGADLPAYRYLTVNWDSDKILARFRAMTPAQRSLPPPCWAAGRINDPPPLLRGLDTNGDLHADEYNKIHKSIFAVPGNRTAHGHLGPKADHLSLSLDYQIAASDPADPLFPPSAVFMIVDIADGGNEILASVQVRPAGASRLEVAGYPDMTLDTDPPAAKSKNRIDMAVLGPWCEIRMNERRVFLGAVPDRPGRALAHQFRLTSVTGELGRFELRPLQGPTAPAPPVAEAPAPPAPSLDVPPPPAEATAAWFHRALVEGYRKQGRRSAAWDPAAVAALAMSAEHLAAEGNFARIGEILGAARKAVEAGCDDPAVQFAYAHALMAVEGQIPEALRQRRRAAERMRTAGYEPLLRALVLLRVAEDVGRSTLRYDRGFATSAAQDAIPLLQEALGDATIPNRPLWRAAQGILDRIPRPKGRPTATLDTLVEIIEKARPGSALAPAAKAYFHVKYAWDARGGGWASTVKQEAWGPFDERLKIAAEACEEAWSRDARDPEAPTIMLSVALGNDDARRNVRLWLDRAMKTWPNNTPACDSMLWFLRPRWGGTWAQMRSLGRDCFERAKTEGEGPEMLMTLVRAHDGIANDQKLVSHESDARLEAVDEYWHHPDVWPDVRDAFEEILRRHPDSSYYQSQYAYYACLCGQWDRAHELLTTLGPSVAPGPFGGTRGLLKMRFQAEREVKADSRK